MLTQCRFTQTTWTPLSVHRIFQLSQRTTVVQEISVWQESPRVWRRNSKKNHSYYVDINSLSLLEDSSRNKIQIPSSQAPINIVIMFFGEAVPSTAYNYK